MYIPQHLVVFYWILFLSNESLQSLILLKCMLYLCICVILWVESIAVGAGAQFINILKAVDHCFFSIKISGFSSFKVVSVFFFFAIAAFLC